MARASGTELTIDLVQRFAGVPTLSSLAARWLYSLMVASGTGAHSITNFRERTPTIGMRRSLGTWRVTAIPTEGYVTSDGRFSDSGSTLIQALPHRQSHPQLMRSPDLKSEHLASALSWMTTLRVPRRNAEHGSHEISASNRFCGRMSEPSGLPARPCPCWRPTLCELD